MKKMAFFKNICRVCKGSVIRNSLRYASTESQVRQSLKTSRPLDGIRICDMSRVLVGPYCTMLLGDMGAEVIKIERPGVGDETRGWGPPFLGSESCYFLSINRNKKGIAVDVKSQKGKDIVYKLVAMSDVFVENFVPGKMAELGFGYEDLVKINPKIIYSSMSGFGDTGPLKEKPGYDLIACSSGGMLSITGEEDEICKPGIALTDLMTGMFSLNAIIQALYERSYTGKGKYISASLFQSQLAMLSSVGVEVLNTGKNIKRGGTSHHAIAPCEVFKTLDGMLAVVASNDADFRSLCKAIDNEDLAYDDRFLSNRSRLSNGKALSDILKQWFEDKSMSNCAQILEKYNVPFSKVNNLKEAYDSEQSHALHMVQELQHTSAGKIRIPGNAMHFTNQDGYDDSKSSVTEKTIPIYNELSNQDNSTPPPILGEHTDDILLNLLGYSQQEVVQLMEEKVVQIN